MYKKILVATDGSTLSKKAVRSGIELARATGGEVVVVNVVPRYPVSYFEGALTLSAEQVARTEQQWADTARKVVDAACAQAGAEGVKARGVVPRSDYVAESLLATARKHRCDLVVMASHGRKGLKRVLLGSETQQVLAQSTVPVLVLR